VYIYKAGDVYVIPKINGSPMTRLLVDAVGLWGELHSNDSRISYHSIPGSDIELVEEFKKRCELSKKSLTINEKYQRNLIEKISSRIIKE
jgi:hypothetical protein